MLPADVRGPKRDGNFIWDYYWGVEFHPELFGINPKQLINCREVIDRDGRLALQLPSAGRYTVQPSTRGPRMAHSR